MFSLCVQGFVVSAGAGTLIDDSGGGRQPQSSLLSSEHDTQIQVTASAAAARRIFVRIRQTYNVGPIYVSARVRAATGLSYRVGRVFVMRPTRSRSSGDTTPYRNRSGGSQPAWVGHRLGWRSPRQTGRCAWDAVGPNTTTPCKGAVLEVLRPGPLRHESLRFQQEFNMTRWRSRVRAPSCPPAAVQVSGRFTFR